MSSPIGHSLAGLIISSWREKSFKPGNLKILALYVFLDLISYEGGHHSASRFFGLFPSVIS